MTWIPYTWWMKFTIHIAVHILKFDWNKIWCIPWIVSESRVQKYRHWKCSEKRSDVTRSNAPNSNLRFSCCSLESSIWCQAGLQFLARYWCIHCRDEVSQKPDITRCVEDFYPISFIVWLSPTYPVVSLPSLYTHISSSLCIARPLPPSFPAVLYISYICSCNSSHLCA